MEEKADFYYECAKCKGKIPATFDNHLTVVEAVEEKKNTYSFQCLKCFDLSPPC